MTCVRNPDPGGAVADTGSHLSTIPKMTIRTIAVTNSGIDVSESPVTVITLSVNRLRRSAATIRLRASRGV